MGWDGLDRWSGAAMLALATLLTLLIFALDTTPPPGSQRHLPTVAAQSASPEYAAQLKVAGQLLAAGNLEKLKSLVDEMVGKYPYQAAPFMLLADYHIRRQQPIAAMHAYRQALDLNMEYLEKKTPLYQGKKIKATVREAEAAINAALTAGAADAALLESRKEMYLMLRKLAGGCSD